MTVGVQDDVCVVNIDVGVQATDIEVIDETLMVALPDLDESCVEVALIVAVPAVDGVKMPVLLTVPTVDGLTDQITAEL